jgi:hypothetical protein
MRTACALQAHWDASSAARDSCSCFHLRETACRRKQKDPVLSHYLSHNPELVLCKAEAAAAVDWHKVREVLLQCGSQLANLP